MMNRWCSANPGWPDCGAATTPRGKRRFLLPAIAGVLLAAQVAPARATDVDVLGLFKDAAMLEVDGKSKMIRVGASFGGVTLLRADSRSAVVEMDGKQIQLGLSGRINSDFAEPETVTLSIPLNNSGQYMASGAINGQPARFLVDTGANIVAMNSETAKALGIDYASGKKMQATTASGITQSWSITLDAISVGGIVKTNVVAAVIEGVYPTDILLGMTFLKDVEIAENSGLMVLTSKFQ